MNINRNNYEEFFLLYVDNELSAAERNAVELFVQENVDLKEELAMLMQTVINADAVSFDKTSLLKEEFTTLQENLLLYIDNELSADDKLKTEKALQADYSALKELGLLQQTKLQPETIVFADKRSLYRKEKGRVIGLPWRRIAAAAILLGFGTWATISFINSDKPKEAIAGTGSETKPVIVKQETTGATLAQQPTVVIDSNTSIATADAVKKQQQKNNPAVNSKEQKNIPQQKNNDITVAGKEIKKPSNNLPKPLERLENINKPDGNNDVVKNVPIKEKAIDITNSGKTNEVAKSNTDGKVDGYALRANYTEGDADNNLFPEDDKGKKPKLGGFFRKVKRLVERNTNVTNGNGIKVAGFDIAIK